MAFVIRDKIRATKGLTPAQGKAKCRDLLCCEGGRLRSLRQPLRCKRDAAVGSVPMRWYKDEEHIGYDRDANKIARKARQDRLDALLARNDSGKAFRTIYDEYNDEDIVLSKQELQMVQRIREGRFPHVEVGHRMPPDTYTLVMLFLQAQALLLVCR